MQNIGNSASWLENSVSLIIQTSVFLGGLCNCNEKLGSMRLPTFPRKKTLSILIRTFSFVFNGSILLRLPKYLPNRGLHFRIHQWNVFKHSNWDDLQLINFLAPLTIAYMYLISRVLIPSLLHYSNFLWDYIAVSKTLFGNYLIFPQLVLFPNPSSPNPTDLSVLELKYQLYHKVYSL